jgi:hypothetical protein
LPLIEAVDDLGDGEPEHPGVDRAREEHEPELLVRREWNRWLGFVAATRAPIPGALHLEDERLRRREVGDGPRAPLECRPSLAPQS